MPTHTPWPAMEGAHSPFISFIGGRLEEARPGYARISLRGVPALADAWGRMHAGAITAIMDSAVGAALGHLKVQRGRGTAPQATIAMDVSFVAPAASHDELVAEGRVVELDRHVAHGEAELRRRDGSLIARGSFVFVVGEGGGWPRPT